MPTFQLNLIDRNVFFGGRGGGGGGGEAGVFGGECK